ncbi:MAG: hypothetical protein QM689_02115 [Oscillospiraceae bacterium]
MTMQAYNLMIKTNHFLIKGGILTQQQKLRAAASFLSAVSTLQQAQRFYKGMRVPDNKADGREMYPVFFVPPYNDGKKLRTILNQTPLTHILSANTYELEIIRLLCLLAPEDDRVRDMTAKTLSRLKTTCFGNQDDGVGECFDASLVVLRFLAAAAPADAVWLQSRMDNYNRHAGEKKRPWFSEWYYWLCLSELPFELAQPELDKYKPVMLNWLEHKSCVMNSEQDKLIHPVILCILRNALSRYPEFAYIKNRQPYVSETDGRLHFNMEAEYE